MGSRSQEVGWCGRKSWGIASIGLLLLLLACLGQGCALFGGPRVRTILPEDKAGWVYVLPDGRRILHTGISQSSMMLLDLATGEDLPISAQMHRAEFLDDDLLYGNSSSGLDWYVVNLRPLGVVKLGPLVGGTKALAGAVREADSVYAIKTGMDIYMLFLLKGDPSANVTAGFYVSGVHDLDVVLAGIPYKIPPSLYPYCSPYEKVPSPSGRYYYILTPEFQIYSQQGDLLNSTSSPNLTCYGWAWDSSGVYVQERWGGLFAPSGVGPLQLLLAKP